MRRLLSGCCLLLIGCVGLEMPKTFDSDDSASGSGVVQANPSSIDFGDVVVGESASQILTLTNTGSSGIRMLSASIDGMGGVSEFTSTFVLPSDLESSADVVFNLAFEPTDPIYYSGSFELLFDDAGVESTLGVALTGAGLRDTNPDDTDDTGDPPGDLEFTPSSIDFGQVDVGRTSAEQLQIQNVGSTDILINEVITGDSSFTAEPSFALPYVMSPGSLKDIDVRFTPDSKGMFNSWIEFQTDDPVNPDQRVTVAGEGADLCDICAPVLWVSATGTKDAHNLYFLYFIAMGIPATVTVTITNEGDMDLEITDITLINDTVYPQGTYALSGAPPSPIGPWDTATFDVTFTATVAVYDWANFLGENYIHIISNDPEEPDYAIALWGTAM